MRAGNHHFIIQTKLAPPSQSIKDIKREPLIGQFRGYQRYRLCVVHAFAGYGKTTLLKQWYEYTRQQEKATAWVTLDEAEREVIAFFTYLVEALEQAGIAVDQLKGLLDQEVSKMSVRALASSIINTLSEFNKDFYLFLDDYHRATSQEVDELLHTLIIYSPDNMHVVMASRNYPAFDLENLRAQGHVVNINAAELAFSIEELELICDNKLSKQDASALLKKTEGWPIACHMAGYLLQHTSVDTDFLTRFSGNTRELSPYISEQIFNTLSADEQLFLILTSATERFTGDLADALDDNLSAWPILETLQEKKLFLTPLDNEDKWYRYHHLIADYLYEKLHRLGEERCKEVHQRAAKWLFAHGSLPEAMEQAFKAQDLQLAAQEVSRAGGWRLAFEGHLDFMRNFLERLPTDIINLYPRLFLASLMKLIREGKDIQARQKGQEFKQQSQDFTVWQGHPIAEEIRLELRVIIDISLEMYADTPTTEEKLRFLADILNQIDQNDTILLYLVKECTMRQYLELGEVDKALATFDEWQALIKPTYSSIYSYIDIAAMDIMQAKLQKADQALSHAMSLVEQNPAVDFNLHAAVSVFVAELDYLRNNIDQAETLLTPALSHLEKYDAGLVHYAPAFTSMLGIARVKGDRQMVLDIIERANNVAEKRHLPRLKTLAKLLQIKYFLLADSLDEAEEAAQELGLENIVGNFPCARDLSIYIPEKATLVLARLCLSSQQPQRTLALLQPLVNAMKNQERLLALTEVYLLMAQAESALDNQDEAIQWVYKAAYICMHENYKRVFIDEGKPGLTLYKLTLESLDELDDNQYLSKFLNEVIQETSREIRKIASGSAGFTLTDIEYQVISELAKGHSNKEIAKALNISVDTVKYRLKKVYKKWNIHSRADAAKFVHNHTLKENT